jgi:alpha-L-fucosidase
MLASPATAQYPPPPSCHLSDTTVDQGDTLGVTGFNWLPDSDVLLQLFSTAVNLGTAHTDGDGAFSTEVTIPANTSVGEHTIRATGQDLNGDPVTVDCGLVVVTEEEAEGAPPAGGGGVAFTGTNVSLGLLILAALILAGAGFTYASRRKKAHADQ